jgi:rhomboid family GlyGly-CTERM serine protease
VTSGSSRRAPGGWPWLTIAVAGVALAASIAPGGGGLLEYDRAKACGGEAWRLLTGQLVHWSARMTAIDIAMVLVLGIAVERRSRRLAALVIAGGLAATALAVYLAGPEVERYRGISGVASSLFVAAAMAIAAEPVRRGARGLAVLALALFLSKLSLEALTGLALFAGPLPAGIEAAPAVHLAGGAAGALAFVVERIAKRGGQPGP